MNLSLFEKDRLTLDDSIELTAESLRRYGADHSTWGVAWSGGKDSTALLTLVIHLIESGQVPRPARLQVMYADTRMELTPLVISALQIMTRLRQRAWIDVRVAMAPLDERFFVYMLGRGVPPPNNNTLRWCTDQIKVKPMEEELRQLSEQTPGKVLMLIGVRVGESAARDGRIAIACGRNGAECGQGWYQQDLPDAICDKLSPILHWRVCHVWDWLRVFAPGVEYGAWETAALAEAYGGDEAAEINARTGCLGCPLASRDTALEAVIKVPAWAYLAPLLRLRPIYRALREPYHRLRQPPGERRKDGTLTTNQNRMGPLTLLSRHWALKEILGIQAAVNAAASVAGRPPIDILNAEEEARIRELIALNTWPRKWTGDEPVADEPYEAMNQDGTRQMLLGQEATP